ncbi:aminoacyl-tRNA hydrolase [Flavobacterium phragmitis]|uniref:Peptidyl-tRNA hydrolase PTH2 n=1 Tax=Flavobacterium phragmitis TaxID=739143 RepID=A0A1I1TJ65_9FLAO|nr:peptidyl-tRNA hydrolase [Flavobacterium phragmitis]SFD55520.1 Peptidyl-tRNA hydrolase PTH2 [Flavobacterium phragmitis]
MKMYILIKEDTPDKLVPVITAHASLACFRKFEHNENMQKWINGIFKKVVCVVSEKEFENAKMESENIVLTESSLENKEVCIAFVPRDEYSKMFKFFRMWTPQDNL